MRISTERENAEGEGRARGRFPSRQESCSEHMKGPKLQETGRVLEQGPSG